MGLACCASLLSLWAINWSDLDFASATLISNRFNINWLHSFIQISLVLLSMKRESGEQIFWINSCRFTFYKVLFKKKILFIKYLNPFVKIFMHRLRRHRNFLTKNKFYSKFFVSKFKVYFQIIKKSLNLILI